MLTTTQLPIARYRFNLSVLEDFVLPAYAGSMLRGVFGHALKEVCCTTGISSCNQCERVEYCAYPGIFESPPPELGHPVQRFSKIPVPYVIEAPTFGERKLKKGDKLCFYMVLTGMALKHLHLIIHSWQIAFQLGLGKQKRGMLILENVDFCPANGFDTRVYQVGDDRILLHNPILTIPEPSQVRCLGLRVTTPLRLQRRGHILKEDEISVRDLVLSLAKRIQLLNEFHNQIKLIDDFDELLLELPSVELYTQLNRQHLSRYSNRQHQKIFLDGLVGNILLEGKLDQIFPLFYLGQWLHIGKGTSLGLGCYQLEQVVVA